MRVAVIGAGPAGFFVAGELLKRRPGCEVFMFERRVAPYGLVRFGVSPDHQLTRRATRMFDQIADHPRFHYCGNVEVGRDLTLEELNLSFHAVVVCTGAEQPCRPDLPGSRLRGVADALDFARWVNNEPDAFAAGMLEGVDHVVIIGNGNVALDTARMLARPSVDWVATDIGTCAMETLIHHRVRHITVAGRRGPAEASFTEAELEELVAMPGWAVRSDGELPFGVKIDKPPSDHVLEFKFHLKTACLLGGDKVVGARFSRAGNGETVELPAQLVIFATGQRGAPLDDLPFDPARGIIPNAKGAVAGAPGFYVCGWIKRGAKGLIGQNRKDAIETAARMLEDWDMLSERQIERVDWSGEMKKRGKRLVTWEDWRNIDAMEIRNGSSVGRPRLTMTRDEALKVIS